MNNRLLLKILTIVLCTAFLGELKVSPFDSSFRFGLGGAGFFFLLLFYRDVPYFLTGLVTGIFTASFRIGLDYAISLDSFSFYGSLLTHSPVIGFYVTFAILLRYIQHKDFHKNGLWIGGWGAFSDAFSNIVLLLVMIPFLPDHHLYSVPVTYVVIIAITRSFFVVGLFSLFEASKLAAVYQVQRSRFEQIQTILSELYIEGFYLKKTLNEIENVTGKSHKLYRELRELESHNHLATLSLTVTQELHEVKKDNQRILAGLEKLILNENRTGPTSLSDIIKLSIKANEKYSQSLKKDIQFTIKQKLDLDILLVYPLLIILNNLIANAIEAINTKGHIQLAIANEQKDLVIRIIDNGVGIHKDDLAVIFEPGYTSKFDQFGKASTGIGLSHVKSMVEEMNGTIHVVSDHNGTVFNIRLPINVIEVKGC
ncbi:sensor histidine kinase [Anaerobacillus sp. MEB173]|uniref:sensor histidine kinase n=1 Tax=Anaerobacillus sp. MEB173 TaxID=3383345 RepID=UPI003F916888